MVKVTWPVLPTSTSAEARRKEQGKLAPPPHGRAAKACCRVGCRTEAIL